MIPLNLRTAPGANEAFLAVNDWADKEELPKFWDGGSFNPNYGVRLTRTIGFPYSLLFRAVYKPDSDDELVSDREFRARL